MGIPSEAGRALTIDVFDTGGASTAVAANVAVSVTAVNDTPVIDNAQLIVEEGGATGVLTVTMTDYDNGGEIVTKSDSSGSFTFTVTSTGGHFEARADSSQYATVTQFTNTQLQGGLVKFVDDIDGIAPTFTIKADDGQSSNNISNTFNGKVTYVTEERVDVQVFDTSTGVAKGSSGLITSEANIGDTVVATYTVPTTGNDIGTVTFNLSQFGGSATTTATKTTVGSNDVYTSADLVLTAGSIDGIAKASVTVTNAATNAKTIADDEVVKIDVDQPDAAVTREPVASGEGGLGDGADANNFFTKADELTFKVTFDEPVTNVGVNDFTVVGGPGGEKIDSVVSQGTTSTVFIVKVTGSGLAAHETAQSSSSFNNTGVTLGFNSAKEIYDAAGNALIAGAPSSVEKVCDG